MLIVRHRLGPLVGLALIGATLSTVAAPASAQPELCFGQPATIEAVAGEPTVGTDGDDVIVGTPGPDDIRGGAGDDRVCGLAGADVISGNRGDDRLDGGGGRDRVMGGKGRDLVIGGSGSDELHGNRGRDLIRGKRGDDLIWGGKGDDELIGGSGDDTISGGNRDDTIFGNSGNDTLTGGKGDDAIEGGRQDDLLAGKSGSDTLRGNRGNDRLVGGRSGDVLFGNAGDDGLFGGPGSDMCRGGKNRDVLVSCEVRPEVVAGVPGDAIRHTLDERLGARKVGWEVDIWLVPFQNPTAVAHAVAGRAAIRSETVDLALTVPDVFIVQQPHQSRPISPLPEGVYAVWVGGPVEPTEGMNMERLGGLLVDVTAAGSVVIPDMSGVVVDPARALLGTTALGDVALGTPVAPALSALEAKFGSPIDDTGWRDGCWFSRSVEWQGVSATFHGTLDNEGRFVSGRFVSFVATGDTVLGPLTTLDGVAV